MNFKGNSMNSRNIRFNQALKFTKTFKVFTILIRNKMNDSENHGFTDPTITGMPRSTESRSARRPHYFNSHPMNQPHPYHTAWPKITKHTAIMRTIPNLLYCDNSVNHENEIYIKIDNFHYTSGRGNFVFSGCHAYHWMIQRFSRYENGLCLSECQILTSFVKNGQLVGWLLKSMIWHIQLNRSHFAIWPVTTYGQGRHHHIWKGLYTHI